MGLLVLYAVVFTGIGTLQFAKQDSFTRRIGNLVVTGHYRNPQDTTASPAPQEFPLTGEVRVVFGGLEFSMTDEDGAFGLVTAEGTQESILPDYMSISGETVSFHIPGGTELAFTTIQDTGGVPELRILGAFTGETRGLVLPFKALRTSRIRTDEAGQFRILAEGVNYGFTRSLTELEYRSLLLEARAPVISYRAFPEEDRFVSRNFVIAAAKDKRTYDEAIARWRVQRFSLWNRSIATTNDEDIVIAYVEEALEQRTYKPAVAAIPAAFLNGNQRTFESSVYLGRLDLGLRSLVAAEREKQNRLSGLLDGTNSRDQFLGLVQEPHLFEYLALREQTLDRPAELIRSIELEALSLDMTAGILEGFSDWNQYRSSANNPFEKFIPETYSLISKGLRKTPQGDQVFVCSNDGADTRFNLRLGQALIAHTQYTGDTDWEAVGRSLVLSVLSLVDSTGMVPGSLLITEQGDTSEPPASPRFNSARLYRLLSLGEYYPRVVSIGTPASPIWTWTAASSVSATVEPASLDIAVSFLVGESHYMLVRGIRPFTRIQLYGINYRTDPQFERYDSSGWTYSASERTLLLKIQHRAPVEHIRIFF